MNEIERTAELPHSGKHTGDVTWVIVFSRDNKNTRSLVVWSDLANTFENFKQKALIKMLKYIDVDFIQ